MTDVPVENDPPRVSIAATAGQTQLSFDFLILKSGHLQVRRIDSAGTVTTLAETTDYTIPGAAVNNKDGGTITLTPASFPSGASAGDTFTLFRQIPIERLSDVPRRGSFRADVFNAEMDTIFLIAQELRDDLGRAIVLADEDPTTGLTLPLVDVRKGKILGFDSTAGQLAVLTPFSPGTLNVTPFIESLLDDGDAATARATLLAQQRLIDILTADGDIAVRSAGAVSRLPLGAANRRLGSDGSGVVYIGGTLGKTANYSVEAGDRGRTILADASAGAITIALPPAATAGDDFDVTVIKVDSSANAVTIDGDGAETINGAATLALKQQYDARHLRTDGAAWYIAGANSPLDLLTLQAASGTAVDFTGIPASAKRITVMFNGVSTNGAAPIKVRLGTSGGFETSGYAGSTVDLDASSGSGAANLSDGFATLATGAALAFSGTVTLTLKDPNNNTWAAQGFLGLVSTAGRIDVIAGTKPLSSTLTQVRITANGVDTFDAGSINVMVE